MDPTKKISFGFSKLSKKTTLLPPKTVAKEENKVELIKCLEGQEIKLVEEKQVEAPLVIHMKASGKTSAALASLMKRRAVLLGEDEVTTEAGEDISKASATNESENNGASDSLEKRAARELLAELQTNGETETSTMVLPVLKPDELPLDGAKGPTMDDYESIPISQYGLAMLREMGWVEPPKTKGRAPAEEAPFVRPKGMGLGADKALKRKPLLVPPEANEILAIKKQAFVRILAGKYKDAYGQIEGFDDHRARIIVKMAIGGTKQAFNEFLCQPVAKKEYTQYGKCINTAKYEEYKKMENEHGQIILTKEDGADKRRLKKDNRSPDSQKEHRRPEDKFYDRQFHRKYDDRDYDKKSDRRYEIKDDDRNLEIKIKEEKFKDEDRKDRGRDAYKDDELQVPKVKEDRKFKEESSRSRDDDKSKFSKRVYEDISSTSRAVKEERTSKRENDCKVNEERDESKQTSSGYYENERQSSSSSRQRNDKSRRSRSPEPSRSKPQTNRHRRPGTPDHSSDTSESSDDSDSAYERSKKSAKKQKSKKSKSKSKHRSIHCSSSDASTDKSSSDSESNKRERRRKHKKKTKKSKRPRSRSRSRGRR